VVARLLAPPSQTVDYPFARSLAKKWLRISSCANLERHSNVLSSLFNSVRVKSLPLTLHTLKPLKITARHYSAPNFAYVPGGRTSPLPPSLFFFMFQPPLLTSPLGVIQRSIRVLSTIRRLSQPLPNRTGLTTGPLSVCSPQDSSRSPPQPL
jgi:hypothetical protein